MKPNSSRLHNPKGLLIPLLIAGLIFGGYLVYYQLLAKKIETILFAQKGKNIDFSNVKFSGFPYRISANLTNFSFRNSLGNSGQDFTIEKFRATASPFEPTNWVIDQVSTPILKANETNLNFDPKNLRASIKLDVQNPSISNFAISFDELTINAVQSNGRIKLGPSRVQFVHEKAPTPKSALNVELSNLDTDIQVLMGVDLDFKTLVLRGPLVTEGAQQKFNIMYGLGELENGKIDEIKGNISLDSRKTQIGRAHV